MKLYMVNSNRVSVRLTVKVSVCLINNLTVTVNDKHTDTITDTINDNHTDNSYNEVSKVKVHKVLVPNNCTMMSRLDHRYRHLIRK